MLTSCSVYQLTPGDKHLCFPVSKDNPQGGPNMYVYDVDKKECIKSLIHKKYQSW